jgi:molybdenum cofactor cytidylyltransferase
VTGPQRGRSSQSIAGVVLAAGLARRMGAPKLLFDLGGRPVVRHAAERLLADGLDPVLAVVGPAHRAAIEAALADLPVAVVLNPSPEEGQSGSVRAGIEALPPTVGAAVIALGDQPLLPAEVVPRLCAAFLTGRRAIVAPRYRDGRGNPVLFAAAMFPELTGLRGDEGARSIIDRDPARVDLVEIGGPMPGDLDTREDYERLRRQLAGPGVH